jgi:hypothetical protein
MVRPRRTLIRLCRCGAFAPLCSSTRPMPAESGSHFLSLPGNFQAFQPSNFQLFLRSIPFRFTFFAHPHYLTLTESYSYKKQGRGWGAQRLALTQAVPSFSTAAECAIRRKRRKPITFTPLLHDLRTAGVGRTPSPSFSSARLRAFCVPALFFSAIRFASLLTAGSLR